MPDKVYPYVRHHVPQQVALEPDPIGETCSVVRDGICDERLPPSRQTDKRSYAVIC